MGSGRQPYAFRKTTEDYLSVDIRAWYRDGMITPGNKTCWQWSRRDKPYATLSIAVGIKELVLRPLETESMSFRGDSYGIELDWTDCRLGGKRIWFRCPLCRNRVAILYWGQCFGCRKCFDLAYASERETGFDKAARRAGWIRKRLGWVPGILNPKDGKPKGMHWQTYNRLLSEYDRYIGISYEEIRSFNCKLL